MSEERVFRLLNDKATALTISGSELTTMKAVIITDCHLNRFLPFDETFPQLKDQLLSLVEKERANTVILLGDIVHIRTEGAAEKIEKVLKIFESLPVKVYYVSGNHDRHVAAKMSFPATSNVTIVRDLALCLVHPCPPPGTPPRIFLTHDLHNHHKLKPHEVKSWLAFLRRTFSSLIDKDDFLLTGHTHETIINEEVNSASVAPFSLDLQRKSYATLTMTKEEGIKVQFCSM